MKKFLQQVKHLALLMFACIAIIMLLTPASANAASKTKNISTIKSGTTLTVGELKYKVTKVTKKGGYATVIGVDKDATVVKIPATIKVNVKKGTYKGVHTIKVNAISKNAFYNNRKITKVTIGDNVKTIGEKAFYKAAKLKQVSIGKNVTTIGKYAFASNINLRKVTVAKSSKLSKINSYAFKNCVFLKNFNFSNAKKLNTIGSFAFYGCDFLTNVPTEKTAEMKTVMAQAQKYAYELIPLFPGFNYYYYVKTNNPSPDSFRFVDPESYMYDEESDGLDYIIPAEERFVDVVYTDESKSKVNGGYLWESKNCELDGGKLNLEIYTNLLDPKHRTYSWVDTGIQIDCPAAFTSQDYLINNYTDSSMTFFEKLSSIQSALYSLAIYPKGTYDSSKRNEGCYPALATSPYYELSLNRHYESIFSKSDKKILAYYSYPYVRDSLSFPGTISSIARRLEPSCKIESGGVHYLIKITFNGESHYYGGAGEGGTDGLYTSCVNNFYKFDGTEEDLGTNPSLKKAQHSYFSTAASSTMILDEFREQLSGETFYNKVSKGVWIKTATEGFFGGGGTSYARYYNMDYDTNNAHLASSIWIDGRYVNQCEFFELGTSFEEHPTSNIVLVNQTYKTYYGDTVTGDMIYTYNSDKQQWQCDQYYYKKATQSVSYKYGTDLSEMPEEFILTKEEVEKLGVDSNKDVYPESGLIYNGTAEPGTPF